MYYAQAYSGHGAERHAPGWQVCWPRPSAASTAGAFDLFAKVPHITFPGGKHLRSPLLALGMLWHRLKELVCTCFVALYAIVSYPARSKLLPHRGPVHTDPP